MAPASPLEEAYRALHLQPSAPPELVTQAYRLLARRHHPDLGGSEREMVELNAAVEAIRRERGA